MTSFVFWMLVASGLGFAKGLVLAVILPSSSFGEYVARFGAATLAAQVVSLGLLERTIKAYPRRFADGRVRWIQRDATLIVRKFALRFASLAAGGALVVAALGSARGASPLSVFDVVIVSALGLGSAWLLLLASEFRGIGAPAPLRTFQLQRTGAALVCGALGGWWFGWPGALGGDITACAVSVIWSRFRLARLYAAAARFDVAADEDTVPAEVGHRALYVANMLSAATQQIDSTVVRAGGSSLAGTYGVAARVPMVAQMLVNVIVQLIGPIIIKLRHARAAAGARAEAIGLQAAALTLFAALLTGGVLAARVLPITGPFLVQKYGLSATAVVLAGVAAAGQIFSVLEFHLIARDRERDVLGASLTASIVFAVGYGTGLRLHWPVEGFLAAAATARWAQVAVLTIHYRRRPIPALGS